MKAEKKMIKRKNKGPGLKKQDSSRDSMYNP